MGATDRSLYPGVINLVREQRDVEFQFLIESKFAGQSVAINEVTRVMDLETVLLEEPRIQRHLPLVADLPIRIYRHLSALRRGFIINDDDLAIGLNPNVINAARDNQIRFGVVELNPTAQSYEKKATL